MGRECDSLSLEWTRSVSFHFLMVFFCLLTLGLVLDKMHLWLLFSFQVDPYSQGWPALDILTTQAKYENVNMTKNPLASFVLLTYAPAAPPVVKRNVTALQSCSSMSLPRVSEGQSIGMPHGALHSSNRWRM